MKLLTFIILMLFFTRLSCAISFDYYPVNPNTSTSIKFVGNVTEFSPVIFFWNFGDGNYTSGNPAYHRYRNDGNYTVFLTVIDEYGNVLQCNETIRVNNTPPVADFIWDIEHPNPYDKIYFMDKSYDPDGEIVKWQWDMGDGSTTKMRNHSHTYIFTGTYNVTLTVWDNDGDYTNITKVVLVKENKPPEAIFVIDRDIVYVGEKITFQSTSFDLDGFIVNYIWNFGDGSIAYGKTVSHAYDKSGEYDVTLTVTDDDNVSSKFTLKVNVLSNNTPDSIALLFLSILILLYHKYLYNHE